MEIFVYVIMIMMLFLAWVWSQFVQVTADSVKVTERVGSTLVGLIFIEGLLGVIAIIYGTVALVNSWKVFMMLMIVMVIILILFWVTYQYLGVVVSRKVPEEKQEKESYVMFIVSVLISVVAIIGIIMSKDVRVAIVMYLMLPIMMIAERFYVVQKKKKEYQNYPKVEIEDVRKAEKALVEKIDKGLQFKVRKNFIERRLEKNRKKTREVMKYNKTVKKEDNKKEDNKKEDNKKEDNKKEDKNRGGDK